MTLPLPKAPDAADNDYRTLEFSYDGSIQGYVVDETIPGVGSSDLQINGMQVRDYRVRVMQCTDGYIADFQAEIDQLKAWGLEKETTIPQLVGHTPLSTTKVYLLHKTPMVMDILERMDVSGVQRVANEATALLDKLRPAKFVAAVKRPPAKSVKFAALVRKPNGDMIWWPIANNQIGIIVD